MEQLKIYAATLEESARQQIDDMSKCEAYKDCIIRIMPDCHAGKGCTIGTVIEVKDRIVPNTVGVDIGCGMLVTELGKQEVNLKALDAAIKQEVPSGFMVHAHAVAHFTKELAELRCQNVLDMDFANRSIGSLGGGNHFIELDEDRDGKKYLVIHSGSRNLGVRVCKHYQDIAINYCRRNSCNEQEIVKQLKAEGREKEIQAALQAAKAQSPKVDKELAYLEGEDMKDYLHDMSICQRYASLNRKVMAFAICDTLQLSIHNQFETIHNYIDVVHKILRKGAVSALNGEQLIIPMNMRDGSLLCKGLGNPDWLYSAPHGAGRLMSRKQAFDTLKMQDFTDTMSDIYSTSVCPETIDESPMAYKPMQEIIDQIGDTVEIIDIIKPIYNFKAKTPEKPDRKALCHKLLRKED